jgi:hypothetical protein
MRTATGASSNRQVMQTTDGRAGDRVQLYHFINNEAPYPAVAMTSKLPSQIRYEELKAHRAEPKNQMDRCALNFQ